MPQPGLVRNFQPIVLRLCACLMTATLEFPVASEWVNIYMYALTQYKGDQVPKDIKQDRLSDYEMGLLNDFRRWIYERRLKERKRRQHAERIKEVAEKRKEKGEMEAQEPGQMALPLVFEVEYEAMGLQAKNRSPEIKSQVFSQGDTTKHIVHR